MDIMKIALNLAKKGEIDPTNKSDNKFAVGCVIERNGEVLCTGYTGEPPWGVHAEDAAIRKARGSLKGYTLYSTLEPCSKNLFTGNKSCCELIIESGIRKVVFNEKEPDTYVINKSSILFKKAGVEVIQHP